MNFNYSGPGLPDPIRIAAEALAAACIECGYAEPAKPAHVFRFRVFDGRTLILRLDTYDEEIPRAHYDDGARELPGFPSSAVPPPP